MGAMLTCVSSRAHLVEPSGQVARAVEQVGKARRVLSTNAARIAHNALGEGQADGEGPVGARYA